jgi:hypothetical protein
MSTPFTEKNRPRTLSLENAMHKGQSYRLLRDLAFFFTNNVKC